jgi:hypothetical protein
VLTRQNLINYYRSRYDFHATRAEDETLPERSRVYSKKKASNYRNEMNRWKFLPDDVFDAIQDGIDVEEPAETPLWHIIVYATEDDTTVVVEYEDIPDNDLPAILGNIREKMRVNHVGDEPDELYTPENEISITPVFEEDDF